MSRDAVVQQLDAVRTREAETAERIEQQLRLIEESTFAKTIGGRPQMVPAKAA